MLVMIPVRTCEEIGVRAIISAEEAEQVILAIPDVEIDMISNWNQRYRENMLRLKSGDLLEVAKVVKGGVRGRGGLPGVVLRFFLNETTSLFRRRS